MDLKLLSKSLPDQAVTKHPTKTYLSSIKAIYVTERFNEAFGIGKWTIKVEEISVDKASGMVVVKVTFEVPEEKIYYESFGGNDNGGVNSKNFDLGDAYKGATTDAITKIGSYLGVGIEVFKGLVKPGVQNVSKIDRGEHHSNLPVVNSTVNNYNNEADNDKPWLTEIDFKNAIAKSVESGLIKFGTPPEKIMAILRVKYKVAKRWEDLIDHEVSINVFKDN